MLLHEPVVARGWHARLELDYVRRGEATVLASRRHSGPLLVQKPLHPEGAAVCQSILVHPPGGIAAGDALELNCRVGTDAHVQITTPGAGKWYRSEGSESAQRVRFEVAARAVCEWLPQETILFDGARATMETEIDIAPGGRFLGWEVLCFGRTAAGERFRSGHLRMRSRVVAGGRLAWLERGTIAGGAPLLDAAPGLGGHAVSGLLLAAGTEADADLIAAMRRVQPRAGVCGVTRLPSLVVARYLGPAAEAARDYFTRLWYLLRPAFAGREAVAPRIWST